MSFIHSGTISLSYKQASGSINGPMMALFSSFGSPSETPFPGPEGSNLLKSKEFQSDHFLRTAKKYLYTLFIWNIMMSWLGPANTLGSRSGHFYCRPIYWNIFGNFRVDSQQQEQEFRKFNTIVPLDSALPILEIAHRLFPILENSSHRLQKNEVFLTKSFIRKTPLKQISCAVFSFWTTVRDY